MRLTLALVVVFPFWVGCDEPTQLTDAGQPGDAGGLDSGLTAPSTPASPAPVEWECPPTWERVEVGDQAACAPWPADVAGCPDAEHRFVGDTACAPLGTCPSGDFADGLPASGVVYVLADADPSGDGSLATPFATIAEGYAAAVDGDTIAVGRGIYDEAILLERRVALVGACAAETELRASAIGPGAATLAAQADGIAIRDLTVGGNGWGLRAHDAEVTLERVIVSGAVDLGLISSGGALVNARDVVVRDIRIAPTSTGGGVAVNFATLVLERGIVEDNIQFGLIANGTAELTLRDVVVRGTREILGSVGGGMGAALGNGVTATYERVVFDDNRTSGTFIQGGVTLSARDVVVRGTQSPIAGSATGGITCQLDGVATLDRMFFDDNVGSAVGLAQCEGIVRDVVVRGVHADPTRESTVFLVLNGASLSLERALLLDNQGGGAVLNNYASMSARDVTIDGISELPSGIGGRAMSLTLGSTATIERLVADGTTEVALIAIDAETVLSATDVVVRDVGSQPETGFAGLGAAALAGGRLELTRARIERAREAGLLVSGEGSAMALMDVVVDETLERPCVVDTCAGFGGGSGIAVVDGAHLEATRFVTRRSPLAGLQLARGATVALMDGLVERNTVGVNVQEVDLDLQALTIGVIYRDNGVNLDASELHIPAPSL